MTPLERMLSWHSNWSLNDGYVKCKACGAMQAESAKENKFPHTETCSVVRLNQSPWQLLDEVRMAFESTENTKS
ncbi:hypothetical protein [Pseudomonas kribbensis]|uniref:Uncharacterized protein n=1 Tax=Pseudomonas kribbensis TaxID=1628086 RepID=A0A4Y8VFZ2_9PSED|nr:hypothetical protein [Pseudomonas kribbensis]TFH79936.1 hypothetical protein E4J90_14770 [Pseudomonas kribbensis]